MMINDKGLYIVLISIHGLIRGRNLELGRDADTGGQTKYVVELARTLATHPAVERVDLMTRLISDPKVDPDYGEPIEEIGLNAYIVRLQCGPKRYLRKEVLWPYLYSFSDNALLHIRKVGKVPDIIHSHYADAGFVGANLSALLGVPHVHTGHSLGREKKRRLLDNGMKEDRIEKRFHMSQRIESEEIILDNASFIIASTKQEVENQYALYDNYQPQRMVVIPPGVDLKKFKPPHWRWNAPSVKKKIERFLNDPKKPMIFAVSRADARKNIPALIRAYGENRKLREIANLVVVAGTRDNILKMDKGAMEVLSDILFLMDKYDLYGSFAFPKDIESSEVPDVYRLARKSRGIFINPALTEPFGLTLLEAAASGLPIVATNDGGPRDILANCKNGLLIDPLNLEQIEHTLIDALTNNARMQYWSRNGLRGVNRHYSWPAHVEKYLKEIYRRIRKTSKKRVTLEAKKSHLPTTDRIIICEIDDTLIGDSEALRQLLPRFQNAAEHVSFGIATGRNMNSTLTALREWGIHMPDLLITNVGTEIYYGKKLAKDMKWEEHIKYRWRPDAIREALKDFPGLWLQPPKDQGAYKISYFLDMNQSPNIQEIRRHLRKKHLQVHLIYSLQAYLDILPLRASKGKAVRYFADKWGFPLDKVMVAGASGNDEEMLRGNTLAVVVGNHSPELNKLQSRPRIYFASGHHAWGILEALDYYDFLDNIRIPETGQAAEARREDEEGHRVDS